MSYTSEVKSKGYSISIVEAETQLLGTKDFDRMSSETLECVYRFAFGRWPYHMTKEAMVLLLGRLQKSYKGKIMRITKRLFGRDVQFRLERNSWSREMTFWILPTLEFMYLTGMGIDRDGNEELCFPGFWNIQLAWIKFSFTICINDKEDEDALAERKMTSIIDYLNAKARNK